MASLFACFRQRTLRRGWLALLLLLTVCVAVGPGFVLPASAATANGEIEGRAAPVARRKCVGGANAGDLCNENADCPGSTCVDRNVYNITVAVHFNASAAQLAAIENLISRGSEILFDVTDGQAEIGEAFIFNDAAGTNADLRVYPATNDTWWGADTGSYKTGGSIHVSINYVMAETAPGETFAHEFVHLVFDARDEYESRTVGCGVNSSGYSCPDAATIAAGEHSCLMDNGGTGASDGPFSELCWGQGDPADLTDISGGNHDATNVTEQSRCRDNRSCWDQVAWSWPNTFLMPAGAPDPGTGGGAVNPTNFVHPDSTTRVVLVLDESGSMSLEDPSRMERLKVAAKDFIALAENGTEVGIVSYSDDAETASGRLNVAIDALDAAHRAACIAAIDSMDDYYRTNIGSGLQKAMDMITAAGGVTANTYIVLMTDGCNNEPSPQANADADLQARLDVLLAAGIPVYVTCTGSDLGLDSQCAEIASGTNGFYVDSSDSAQLPEAFVDLHEKLTGREIVESRRGSFLKSAPLPVMVEEGSESATFSLLWENGQDNAVLIVTDPKGNQYQASSMPQGRWLRVPHPEPGTWTLTLEPRGESSGNYVMRAYSRNPNRSLTAAPRYPSVLPGEELYVYAYPRGNCGPIGKAGSQLKANVTRPDGSNDVLYLSDDGRNANGEGDDVPGDGIYTGIYTNTALKGSYEFHIDSFFDVFYSVGDRPNVCTQEIMPFKREVRFSAAVGDPNDVEPTPEDGFPFCTPRPRLCEKRVAQTPIPWQFWSIVGSPTGAGSVVTDRIRISPTWLEPLPGHPAGEGPVFVQRWTALSPNVYPLDMLVWDFEKNRPGMSLDWQLEDKEGPVKVVVGEDLTVDIPVSSGSGARAVLVAYRVLNGRGEEVAHFINEAVLRPIPGTPTFAIVTMLVNFDVHNDTGQLVTDFELDFHNMGFDCGDVKGAIGYITAQGEPPVSVPPEPWGANDKYELVVRPIPGVGTEVKWVQPDRPLEPCEWLHVGLVFECNNFDCFNNPQDPVLRATVQGYWTTTPDTVCDDKNPCTRDWCDIDGNCRHAPVPDGTACEADGKLCTVGRCYEGVCREVPVICPDDGNRCSQISCDPRTGLCDDYTWTVCDDNDECTEDWCDPPTGQCVFQSIDCDDQDPCTIDWCENGECFHKPKCDDGDPCTKDICDPVTGGCIHIPKNCDDQDPCTRDWCDPQTGECKHAPMDCNDGKPCTIDFCRDGQCFHVPKDCDDNDPCTRDWCDPETGECKHAPIDCDDQDPCTVDKCVDGQCVHAPKQDSDDDRICDERDNCILVFNPDQRDTDNDGYGNMCDGDLNNDLSTNSLDLGLFRQRFFTNDPHADFNGDGAVNSLDLGLFRKMFMRPPGPSGVAP